MKRPRLRKWAKWICTLAAVLAVSAAVLSRFYGWSYSRTSNFGDTLWSIGVYSGQVLVLRMDGVLASRVPKTWGWEMRWSPHWYWGYAGETSPYGASMYWHAGVMYLNATDGWDAGASVLYPVALTLIPAALLWYADRRRYGPGACAGCGYDHSGLAADAPCPECGKSQLLASK